MAAKINTFVSDGAAALNGAVQGFVALYPQLVYHEEHKVVHKFLHNRPFIQHCANGKLLAGGSGHEPAHAGYVGDGMLDAAVCGAVFASPNALQVETGLRLIESPGGILVIVKNYTGDKLNFTLAAERFRYAAGIAVRLVVVGDDVSIGRTRSALIGRRGLAGTVLIHKIAGAAAAAGLGLGEVADAAEFALCNMGTVGVGLDACDLPGNSHQSRLGPDEIEIGIGIHNEPGSRRVKPQPSLAVLVADMLSSILDISDTERNYLASVPQHGKHDVILLVNNLGGLSTLEIAAVTGEAIGQLRTKYQLKPSRVYAGTFLSALNGPGFSITVLSLPKSEGISSRIIEWLDAPTEAFGWTCSISTRSWEGPASVSTSVDSIHHRSEPESEQYAAPDIPCDPALFTGIVKSVHKSIAAAEPEITRMDTVIGDGDCGTTLLAGSTAVVSALEDGMIETASLGKGMMAVANVIARSMGGTSGALYAVFFTALASAICTPPGTHHGPASFSSLVEATNAALRNLEQVTAAREGDRTMMDALIPFARELSVSGRAGPVQGLDQAVEAADSGCKLTRNLPSKFGRSTYVSAEASGETVGGIPDPGAYGVVAIVSGIRDAFKAYNTSS
ncbi:Dihydroxyacetone kinase [Tolypocladium ophioglossoides CBS 100239]|uniref:Dihydroxyacetone kinase n=1 Tax=Tolypocladium ophioglossoides (strain CBS 100239) TaxID=1163406 RepID=A0A0L0N378_TOLOC|nr:Dihydroxyacetone kinase [Tolypocladium ophioglossoides CBS 100239]